MNWEEARERFRVWNDETDMKIVFVIFKSVLEIISFYSKGTK
jgi:hypothetical protein